MATKVETPTEIIGGHVRSIANNVVSLDPYTEGKTAYHQGKTWSDNPYAHMALSPHAYLWMCGWDDGSLDPLHKGRDHVYMPRNPVY